MPLKGSDQIYYHGNGKGKDGPGGGKKVNEYDNLESGELAWILGRRFGLNALASDGDGTTFMANFNSSAHGLGMGYGPDRMQRLAAQPWIENYFASMFATKTVDLHRLLVSTSASQDAVAEIRHYREALAGATVLNGVDVPQLYNYLFGDAATADGWRPSHWRNSDGAADGTNLDTFQGSLDRRQGQPASFLKAGQQEPAGSAQISADELRTLRGDVALDVDLADPFGTGGNRFVMGPDLGLLTPDGAALVHRLNGYATGLFVLEEGPFLRGKMVEDGPTRMVDPKLRGPDGAGASIFGYCTQPRNLGDSLAFDALYAELRGMSMFDWTPDGMVLSKLESPSGDPLSSAELDARQAQLFNVAIQGPALAKTWTGDPEMATMPMDKVFVVVVADVVSRVGPDPGAAGAYADKATARDAATAGLARSGLTNSAWAGLEAFYNSGGKAGLPMNYNAAYPAWGDDRGRIAAPGGTRLFKATMEQAEAAFPAPTAGTDEVSDEVANYAQKVKDYQEAFKDFVGATTQDERNAARAAMDLADADMNQYYDALDAIPWPRAGQPGSFESMELDARNARQPAQAAVDTAQRDVVDKVAEIQRLTREHSTAAAAGSAGAAAKLAEKQTAEGELPPLRLILDAAVAVRDATLKAYDDLVKEGSRRRMIPGRFDGVADKVRRGVRPVTHSTMTNFRLRRVTSSYLAQNSRSAGTSAEGDGRPSSARCGLRMGKRLALATDDGEIYAAEYIIGGWCVGTVLDNAASRSTVGHQVRITPASMQININVNVEWWSGDKLYRHYMDVDGTVLARNELGSIAADLLTSATGDARVLSKRRRHTGQDVKAANKREKGEAARRLGAVKWPNVP